MEPQAVLQVRCLRVGHTETITLDGDLDALTAPLLAEAVSKALAADVGKIIIDAADLAFIDSTGIGSLVQAWNAMRGRATMPVVVTNMRPNVLRVLDICGVTNILTE